MSERLTTRISFVENGDVKYRIIFKPLIDTQNRRYGLKVYIWTPHPRNINVINLGDKGYVIPLTFLSRRRLQRLISDLAAIAEALLMAEIESPPEPQRGRRRRSRRREETLEEARQG